MSFVKKQNLLNRHFLFITLPSHLSFLALSCLFYRMGLLDKDHLYLTFIGWVSISGLGISVGYHRLFSHRAFAASPFLKRILAYLGCLGAQGSPQFWTAIHMGLHHLDTEGKRDIHSPVHGIFSSYIGWQLRLAPEDVPFRYALALQSDPFMRFLHRHYTRIVWSTLIVVAAFSPVLMFYLILIPMIISIHQENLINSFSHLRAFGYRNFETKDDSVNNWLLALFTFGQAFHNNHHALPAKANFGSVRWFEWDTSVPLIAVITRMDNMIFRHFQRPRVVQESPAQSVSEYRFRPLA